MTENQKLREVLHKIIEIKNKMEGSDWEEIEEAREIARQALAMPTAAPVGERDRFEKWAREQFYSGLACPSDTWSDERKTYNDAAHHMALCAFKAATQMTEQAAHEEIARLRAENAALSAGDTVDAQRYRLVRRGQHFSIINGIGDMLRGENLDAEADAAMRKSQL